MKKLIILLCMAAVLCGCSKSDPTTEATTERELPITGYHFEGAVFSIDSDWETETRDGKFYMYPDETSFLSIEYSSLVKTDFDESELDVMASSIGLKEMDTTTKRISENTYGYKYAEVGGLEDIDEGTFWVYEDVILTQNGTYTVTMFNDTKYNDTEHLYSTDGIVSTFRLE